MTTHFVPLVIGLLARTLLPLAALGCETRAQAPEPTVDVHVTQTNSLGLLGYEPGTWWQQPDELEHVVLSASHIVIAHSESAFHPVWGYAQNRKERTRDAAQQMATALARRLQKHPEDFDALARRHSDDLATAPLGGAMGVRRATQLQRPIVDALGHLKSNEISHVVETATGFHIVRRESLPLDEVLSGAQILIDHSGAWPPQRATSRSREDALKLARRIAIEARDDPDRFGALAAQYSVEERAQEGGAMGAWSLHERSPFPVLVHALRDMSLGEVRGVLEDAEGFHVLKRTPEAMMADFWLSSIIVRHRDSIGIGAIRPVARTREDAARLSLKIVRQLRAEPDAFARLAAEHCDDLRCTTRPLHWSGDAGPSNIARVVSRLAPGEFSRAPIETLRGFYIVRRELPVPSTTAAPIYTELPRPPRWKIGDAIASHEIRPGAFRSLVPWYVRAVVSHLGLQEHEKRLATVFGELAEQLEQAPRAERRDLYVRARAELQALLPATRQQELEALESRWLMNVLYRDHERK